MEPSRTLLQDDPERAEEEARLLLEQQRREKKRNKKKEYVKKKKAKMHSTARPTRFDERLLEVANSEGAAKRVEPVRLDYLQEASNFMMARYELLLKKCHTSL